MQNTTHAGSIDWHKYIIFPCRLKAKHVMKRTRIKCPRQELNLVLDLRRVGCESGTPRGLNCGEPRNEQNPRRSASLVGSPLTAFTLINTKSSRL